MFTTDAEVKVKDSQGKVLATQKYAKIVFEGMALDGNGKVTTLDATVETLLKQAIDHFQALNPKGNGVVDLLENVTYANDLGARAKVRAQIIAATAGPDKAIDKMVKDFMAGRAAAGKPVTEDVARARVVAMMAE
jgi:uncharacterized protein with beta-barrel porin domain